MKQRFSKLKLKELIIALALPLAAGGLSAFLSRGGMEAFQSVRQPPLSPPQWVFPVAWTILYVLMGLASYLVYTSKAAAPRKERALTLYALQLAVNFLWPLIFFGLELYLAAFLVLVLLWLLSAGCLLLFYYIHRRAGLLLLPYLLWLSFAGYLNLGVYLLNRP